MTRRTAAALLAALVLAGCGDIPQPFRHEGETAPLTRPKLARGLTLRSLDVPGGDGLVKAVAKLLEETYEIPVTLHDGPAFGQVARGVVEERGGARGLSWRLAGADGAEAEVMFQPLTALQAKPVAAALASRLEDPDGASPAGQAVARRTTVRVLPLVNLPGDGNSSLAKATRRSLERGGLVVADEGGDYLIEARVDVIPGLPGEDTVSVSWTVKDAAGKRLAVVDQEGVVPRGRLQGPWGTLARDIAEGGAMGIRDAVKAASDGR